MDEEIMRIQCEEGDKQMDLLRAAASCIRAAEKNGRRPPRPDMMDSIGFTNFFKYVMAPCVSAWAKSMLGCNVSLLRDLTRLEVVK